VRAPLLRRARTAFAWCASLDAPGLKRLSLLILPTVSDRLRGACLRGVCSPVGLPPHPVFRLVVFVGVQGLVGAFARFVGSECARVAAPGREASRRRHQLLGGV
jgi:hypothetical protein